jgi:signal transduction histidine kinase
MNRKKNKSLFPPSIFFVYLLVLLVMAGVHTGLLTLMEKLGWNDTIQIILPVVYWSIIAAGLTIFTRWRIQKTYDIPVQRLAKAAQQVAEGDFSIYVPTMHTAENKDYLDRLIDDFNKMVAELGSMETLKTDFFANVSHEFKTPLAGIQNNAMLLQRKNISEKEQWECADAIVESTRRLSDLISNMLKLNKLEKQTIVPKAEPYDLCEQLCECVIQFDGIMEKKEIEFEADLEDQAVIAADESLMELVWNNLLSNAIKFTPDGGSIVLHQHTDADGIIVSVSDTGCGMDSETQKKIFEKFYQGDTSHATEGNGLGLALVLRVLHLLDCQISVQSELGKGSVFTVHIPLKLLAERN